MWNQISEAWGRMNMMCGLEIEDDVNLSY